MQNYDTITTSTSTRSFTPSTTSTSLSTMYLVLIADNFSTEIAAFPADTKQEARDLLRTEFLREAAQHNIVLGKDGFPPLADDAFDYAYAHDGCALQLSEDTFLVYGDDDLVYGNLVAIPGWRREGGV